MNIRISDAPTSCKACGGTELSWDTHNRITNAVQQNHLNTHDVQCVFVLGCDECSETLFVMPAGAVAALLSTGADQPAALGADDGMDLLDQLSKRLPSRLMDRVNEALAARQPAAAFARQLIDSGAENYIGEVFDTERGDIEVTARYVTGKTPGQKLAELEATMAAGQPVGEVYQRGFGPSRGAWLYGRVRDTLAPGALLYTTPSPCTDLRQFRAAVEGWRESLDRVVADTSATQSARRVAAGKVGEAIRLLTLIDSQRTAGPAS